MIRSVVSAVPDIILHIEATLGQVGQRQTGDESLAPLEAEVGEAWMLLGRRDRRIGPT
jgi:hypothetical protein